MALETELNDLEREILRTIAYFDVFSYPLTGMQLHSFIAHRPATDLQLQESLRRLEQKKLIRSSRNYFFSPARTDNIVTDRLQNERRASTMLKQARWVSFFLKQVPFVRGVFITGSLSKHVAPHKSDIDFMIVTELNRLWICKMILTGIRRIFLFNSKKYFCMNLMVTEKAMYFPDHNYYTAIEIATTQVAWNTTVFLKYQNENAWIRQYLPNWRPLTNAVPPLSNTPSRLQKVFEALLSILQLNALNMNLMHTARNFWKRKHRELDEIKFDKIIQCTPDISSVWHDDHQSRIQDGFYRRLAVYGIREAA